MKSFLGNFYRHLATFHAEQEQQLINSKLYKGFGNSVNCAPQSITPESFFPFQQSDRLKQSSPLFPHTLPKSFLRRKMFQDFIVSTLKTISTFSRQKMERETVTFFHQKLSFSLSPPFSFYVSLFYNRLFSLFLLHSLSMSLFFTIDFFLPQSYEPSSTLMEMYSNTNT